MNEGVITIAGKDLHWKRTLGAMRAFDTKFKAEGVSVLNIDRLGNRLNIDHMVTLMLLMINAGQKAYGENPISIQWLDEFATDDDLSNFMKQFAPQEIEADPLEKKTRVKEGT